MKKESFASIIMESEAIPANSLSFDRLRSERGGTQKEKPGRKGNQSGVARRMSMSCIASSSCCLMKVSTSDPDFSLPAVLRSTSTSNSFSGWPEQKPRRLTSLKGRSFCERTRAMIENRDPERTKREDTTTREYFGFG